MSFVSEIRNEFFKFSVFGLSAQLAYYFLISFFPFLLLLVTLLGYLPFTSGDVLHMVHSYMPSLSNKILKENLEVILDKESLGLFSLSLVATVYLASVAFQSLIRVLDIVYRVEESRTLWKEWIVGIMLVMGLLLALVLSLIPSVFGDVISNPFFHMGSHMVFPWKILWTGARWLVSSLLLLGLFLCLYVFSPNVRVAVKDALPGSIFVTFAWQISSLLFSYYIDFVDYSYIYGKLGSAMILVGWFYWSSIVLIIGGLMNAVLTRTRVGTR